MGPSSAAVRSDVVGRLAQQFKNADVPINLSSEEDCWSYVEGLQQRTRRLVGTKAYREPEIVSLLINLSFLKTFKNFFLTTLCAK